METLAIESEGIMAKIFSIEKWQTRSNSLKKSSLLSKSKRKMKKKL